MGWTYRCLERHNTYWGIYVIMTHLKITQSDTSEMLGSSSNTIGARIIKKLYELALAGLDNTSELSGVVSVDKAHRNAVEYL